MHMAQCPSCGASNSVKRTICFACGAVLAAGGATDGTPTGRTVAGREGRKALTRRTRAPLIAGLGAALVAFAWFGAYRYGFRRATRLAQAPGVPSADNPWSVATGADSAVGVPVATPKPLPDGVSETDQADQSSRDGTSQAGAEEADRAARSAEIRIEYRKLQQARDAYYGRRWPPFREVWGGRVSPSSNEDVLRVADAAWADVVQQDGVVRELLGTYAQSYGDEARDALVQQERMDMAPPQPQHTTGEQRRALRNEMGRRASEQMQRATQSTGPDAEAR
jgi:hypothetical protein